MLTKKWLLAAVAAGAMNSAGASTMCAGETYSGDVVVVSVRTVGTMGAVQSGRVEVSLQGGGVYAYGIRRSEIPQFFEDEQRSIVGLAAYVDTQGPVLIRYVGENYETENQRDLVDVLKSPRREYQSGNEMRVWKGPGFSYNIRYLFRDVVCSIIINP